MPGAAPGESGSAAPSPAASPSAADDETTVLLRPAIPLPASDAAPPAGTPREGLALGPVSLVRQVGQGGMGTVWLGRHQLLGRDVAVKFLSAALRDEPALGGFVREARSAAGVRHPNLVQVHDCDRLPDGTPYLVMEYVAGPTLRQAVAREGLLDLPTAVLVLEDVAAAVDELHRHGVIHRDLKPSNVLLSGSGAALVADFGLALRRAHGVGSEPAALAGTPAYMAPEAFGGEVSARADVYALGLMTYEMLTGAPPFSGDLDALRDAHLNHPPPPGPLRAAGVPDGAIEVIERAAHKRPLFRYKTAADFVRALRAACDAPVPEGEQRKRVLLGALASRVSGAAADQAGGPSSPQFSAAPSGSPPALDYERAPVAPKVPEGPSSSYYETIARLSSQKREQHERLSGQWAVDEASSPRGQPPPLPPEPEPETLPPGVLRIDVPCYRCGFNLRVASPNALCPECAHPVADSVRIYEAVLSPTYLRPLGRMLLLLSIAAPLLWMPSADWLATRAGVGLGAVGLTVRPTVPLDVLLQPLTGPAPRLIAFLAAPWLFLLAAAAVGMPLWPPRAGRPWAVRVAAGGLVGAGLVLAWIALTGHRGIYPLVGPLLLGLAPLTFACFRRARLAAAAARRVVLARVLAVLTFVLTAGAVAATVLALAGAWAAWGLPPHDPSGAAARAGFVLGPGPSASLALAETEGFAAAARFLARATDGFVLACAAATLASLLTLRRRLPKLPITLFPDDGPTP